MTTTKRRAKRPRSDWSEADKAAWRARKQGDMQIATGATEAAARALSARPDLIDMFCLFAARVQAHRTLRNALAMFGQNPSATRVHAALFWAKEDRAVLPEATPMCVIAKRRGGKRVEEYEDKQTGETKEADAGSWTGFTSERVFDVRDTVPKSRPCQCGTQPGDRCPDTCPVFQPVMGQVPSREEVAELLNEVLRDEGGFDPDVLDECDGDE